MIVDSHLHFWDPSVLRYPWISGIPALNRAFRPDDYKPFADGSIHAAIFVEANCDASESEREVAMVEGWAKTDPRIAGIVAYVDMLDAKHREAVLARLETQDRVVGVRHNIQHHAPGFCIQREFVNGVQHVGEMGFTFDLCATTEQLRDVCALVERCEKTEFVLDHCGKPDIAANDFSQWAKNLDAISRLPNVNCKLSGLLTQSTVSATPDTAIVKYLSHAIGCFGPERVLYGSDWPVSTLNGGESVWRKQVEQLCSSWTPERRLALFGNNAIRIYNLSIPYSV